MAPKTTIFTESETPSRTQLDKLDDTFLTTEYHEADVNVLEREPFHFPQIQVEFSFPYRLIIGSLSGRDCVDSVLLRCSDEAHSRQ